MITITMMTTTSTTEKGPDQVFKTLSTRGEEDGNEEDNFLSTFYLVWFELELICLLPSEAAAAQEACHLNTCLMNVTENVAGWLAGCLKEKVLTEVGLEDLACQTELKNYNSTVSLNHQTWGLNDELVTEFGKKSKILIKINSRLDYRKFNYPRTTLYNLSYPSLSFK